MLSDVEHGYTSVEITNDGVMLTVQLAGSVPYTKLFVPSIKRNTNYGYIVGKNDLSDDYGLTKQLNFFEHFFGMAMNDKSVCNGYMNSLIEDLNDYNFMNQTKRLFTGYANQLNKVITTDDSIMQNISKGIYQTFSGQHNYKCDIVEFDNTNFQIYVIKYQSVEDCLRQYGNIRAKVKKTVSPTLEFVGENDRSIFSVIIRREKYPSTETGYRYKAYIEPSKDLMDNLLK